MARPHGFWLTVVILLAPAPPAAIAQSRSKAEGLVPARFQAISDSLGFQWDLDEQGIVNYGTNRCFQGAGVLQVNGATLSPSAPPMMTADGKEYVLPWSHAGVQITRRVRVDADTGTLRYVEVFENLQTSPASLNVTITTALRSSIRSVMTDAGRLVAGSGPPGMSAPVPGRTAYPVLPGYASSAPVNVGVPLLSEGECGLLITRSSSSYPAVLIYLAGPQSKLKPTMIPRSSRQFTFSYPLVVPPKKRVAIVHGLAQRTLSGAPDAKALADLFKPFRSRHFTQDLPPEIRQALLNAGRSYDVPRAPLLMEVMDLAGRWNVERGDTDVLAQDEDNRVLGTVRGGALTIHTRYGQTTVALGDVALLLGGGGVGRTMRVHLRNGEVLVGEVQAAGMTLQSESGLEVELDPRHLAALFMHVDPVDGEPPPETVALLKTYHGDQLALAGDSPSRIRAVSAWGPFEVPIQQIDYLYPTREPQPVHRLLFNDKTHLSVMLLGAELELSTPRFGSVKVAPGEIRRWMGVKVVGDQEGGENGDGEEISVPHCRLAGENVLVGEPDTDKIELLTAGGATSIETGRVQLIEREDEDAPSANPAFRFELADGTELAGRFRDGVFPFRALGQPWRLPASHVLSFRRPGPEAAEEPAEDETADTPRPSAKPVAPGGPTRPPRPPGAQPFGPPRVKPLPGGPFGP